MKVCEYRNCLSKPDYEIEFDTGMDRKEIVRLCKLHNDEIEVFKNFRTNEKRLGDDKID